MIYHLNMWNIEWYFLGIRIIVSERKQNTTSFSQGSVEDNPSTSSTTSGPSMSSLTNTESNVESSYNHEETKSSPSSSSASSASSSASSSELAVWYVYRILTEGTSAPFSKSQHSANMEGENEVFVQCTYLSGWVLHVLLGTLLSIYLWSRRF